jgi:gluconokinase
MVRLVCLFVRLDNPGTCFDGSLHAGLPLDDDDRKPWLLRLRHLIRDAYYSSSTCVLACSALKKAYRDMLQGDVSATEYVRFVWLDIHPNMAKERCKMRGSHFFPPSLIDSQYAILDMTEEECFCRIQIEPGLTVDDIVNITMDRILS